MTSLFHLQYAVPIGIGLSQQRFGLLARRIRPHCPQYTQKLCGVYGVCVVFVVKRERAFKGLQ